MQIASNARRASRLLCQSPMLLNSHHFHFLSSNLPSSESHHSTTLSPQNPFFSGITQRNHWHVSKESTYFMMSKAFYTSGVDTVEEAPTEAVKELYDKMLDSVNVRRSMPPNAWMWSMIANCKHQHDIKLLFDILQNLRRFRLSKLRIHDNFNCHLCREVAKACVKAGALDFGKKTLWKYNVYGLAPSVTSAHYLLSHAKDHNDTELLVEVMKLQKRNDLPLQPGTADIVFSICYNADDWELIDKYAKRFVKAGVKLRRTSFDTWMKFAAKRGDTESLWKIEKLRSESMKQHTLETGFSCAKGLLLENKPRGAAAVIQHLNQTLPDAKKSGIKDEVQKLISEWRSEVLKHQNEEKRKAIATSLKSNILALFGELNMGFEASINLEDLNEKEGIPQ